MNGKELEGTALAVHQLEMALRARVPLIAIETPEESRVLSAIMQIAEKPTFSLSGEQTMGPRRVFRWTHTRGIKRMGELPEGYIPEFSDENGEELDTTNPSFAIQDYISFAVGDGTVESAVEHASVLVLCDIHRFLTSDGGGQTDLRTMRSLRDLTQDLPATKSTAVIVGPFLGQLGDADRDTYRIKWPLPTARELTNMVRLSAERLPPTIEHDVNGNAEDLGRALAGLTMTEAKRALALSIVETGELTGECVPVITSIKTKILEESQGIELHASVPSDQVGGLEVLKADIAGLPKLLTQDAADALVETPRGILLAGPPGTGKSLCASVIGNGTMPILKWDMGTTKSKWHGETEANVSRVLASADAIDQVVLLLDEGEKQTGDSGGEGESGSIMESVMGQLLTWMQDKTSNVIVVMTVNHPEKLRTELESRFNWRYFVGYPGLDACRQIVRIHCDKRKIEMNDGEIEAAAQAAYKQQLSGREIEDGVSEAHRVAYMAGRVTTAQDVIDTMAVTLGVAENRKAEIEAMVARARGKYKMASAEDAHGTRTRKAAAVNLGDEAVSL